MSAPAGDAAAGPGARPDAPPPPAGELERLEAAWRAPRGWRVLKSVNNTHVGLFYIATAFVFLLLAGVLALLIRAQLAWPGNTLLSERTYNQVFTMHGTVMMFLFAVPMVEAIAVYLLPGMLGARDLPFPRLSAYAFWAYAIGGLAFFCTLFFGLAPDGGWFMYPPLSSATYSPGLNADFWLLGIGFIEISAIAGAVELIVGILFTRAPGMTLARMPVFAWAMLVVALMIVFAFPAVIAGTALLELERAFDWPFFIAERGGDPLLWQHLFWFFGHPEVYIIFLPAAALVSTMVPVIARAPLAGHRAVVAALVAVGVFSFLLWIHHMFTAGLGTLAMQLTSAASLAIAVPSAVQFFAWLATLAHARARIAFTTPALFVLGFFCLFAIGGLTGVMVAVLPFDWQVHDSYFVVAHLHYVLIGGMVFPVFAALYHWLPLVRGRRLSERVGRWVFGLMFVGFNVAFFPMHLAGLAGMPRRVATFAPGLGWEPWNALSSLGAFVFAAGVGLFLFDAGRTLLGPGRRRHGNPWGAATLEWLPAAGAGNGGPLSIPDVRARDPLWAQPGLAAEVDAGAHWLPGSATGGRETLVTTPLQARLSHLIVLPGDSWLPLAAGAGTAGFFLLLTVKLTLWAWASGLGALAAVLAWLWQAGAPADTPFSASVQIGRGVSVPVGAPRRALSHLWWGMAVLVAVLASVFASLLFAHVHVSLAAGVCPPPGARLPAAPWPALTAIGHATAIAATAWLLRRPLPPQRGSLIVRLALATAFAIAANACQWIGHAALDPRAEAWSATVAAMLAFQGLCIAALVLMNAALIARAGSGRLGESARGGLDACALFGLGVLVQGLLLEAAVQGLPLLLNGS
ncbi:MAG: cbb3-type cytochrome c oxidase subunit I [Rubrivivax sp.]|nr:cbb3-type cytochrome c oxidase subunit I [Rubrivivax sp.]